MEHSTAIVWFRRDLRLTDNTALNEAIQCADRIVLVYLLSDWKDHHPWTGEKRQSFLAGSLLSLKNNIEFLGGELIFRTGNPTKELHALASEANATAVFCNRSPDPEGRAVEQSLQRSLENEKIAFHCFKDHALHERDEVMTNEGTPYRVFTPYSRRWNSLTKALPKPAPSQLQCVKGLPSLPCPDPTYWGYPSSIEDTEAMPAGERAARERMKEAVAPDGAVSKYEDDRDTPSGRTTSRLSQDLRFGLISIRELHQKAQAGCDAASSTKAKANWETYLKELAWREFYMQILWHFPEVLDHEFNSNYIGFPWNSDPADPLFLHWKKGETGFPIVDAGMRQLAQTGFMHNRVRMIVSMFLTKDLHIDWRLGEQYFMQQLIDGEIASNNGGWQWSAGTGADAAPYFRIQNPWTQTKRFDPQGDYIRSWIPELAEIPAKKFFAAPTDKRSIASGYPLPIVDHAIERQHTLDAFAAHRSKIPKK